jgi:hypothetical protein
LLKTSKAGQNDKKGSDEEDDGLPNIFGYDDE